MTDTTAQQPPAKYRSHRTADPVRKPLAAGGIAIAAVAVGLAPAVRGSDPTTQATTLATTISESATTTGEAAPTTSAQAYTIAHYIRDNGIVETAVKRGDPGSPTRGSILAAAGRDRTHR